MNSTLKKTSSGFVWAWFISVMGNACLAGSALAAPASDVVPRPAALEPDVRFWVRVYSEIDTNAGFLHDERDLRIVYETLRFTKDIAPNARREQVDAARERYAAALRRIADAMEEYSRLQQAYEEVMSGAPPAINPATSIPSTAASSPGPIAAFTLSAEERRIRDLWGKDATPTRLREAAQLVRFQLGQADRFRAGLERSGAWQTHIAQVLTHKGLPVELVALPHVESSFDPDAYSKVGAAGMWQFMRSTGRRYLRIDTDVDERLDPYRSTEAAAQLLSYNYRLLGSWPLALTAYNHGAAGMRRAKEAMGTDDIVTIVRHHRSPSFGFASRNFYVSFLAALEIDRNPEKYFGPVKRAAQMQYQEIELPIAVPVRALETVLGVPHETLRAYNPSLMSSIWNGKRPIPRRYRLRLPADMQRWSAELLAQRLAPSTPTAPARGAVPVAVARTEVAQDATALATVGRPAERAEPVSAAQAAALSPALGPAVATPQSPDPLDYAVAADGRIQVVATETLGHYADWLGVTPARLRALNKLKAKQGVQIGRKIKLDFSKTERARFEERRQAYHRSLQASFFAAHRIVGTQVYVARRGDSLWSVSRKHGQLPVWLVQQYNPDVNLNAMRAGTQIVVPQVEAVS